MTTNCSSSWIAEGSTRTIQNLEIKLVTGGTTPSIKIYAFGNTYSFTFSAIGSKGKTTNPDDPSEYFITEFLNYTNLNAGQFEVCHTYSTDCPTDTCIFNVGTTKTISNCTLEFKEFLGHDGAYASINIEYPWGVTHNMSLLKGEEKIIQRNTNEYVTIKYSRYISTTSAEFIVKHIDTPAAGAISCTSNPDDAKVYYKENDNDSYTYMGITGLTIENVPSGIRYIKMTLAGYYDHEDSYYVEANKTKDISVMLDPIETKGSLYCSTFPIGANIYLNNVAYGTTNKEIDNLEPGTYTLKLVLDGYETYTKTISINAGLETTVFKELVLESEPTCISYATKAECEAANCYWWDSNQTCQSSPDGTTDYFDIYINPYSWYDGKYEEAISKTLEKVAELGGAISNYLSTITGYEYIGIDVLEDANKERIILRIYLKDTNTSTLFVVSGAVIGAIIGIVAGILIYSIGYITGTDKGEFSEGTLTEQGADIVENGSYAAYMSVYNIDETTAKEFIDCISTATTDEQVDYCATTAGIVLTKEDQIAISQILESLTIAVKDGLKENTDLDAGLEEAYNATIAAYIQRIADLENNVVTPEGAAKDNLNDNTNLVVVTNDEATDQKLEEDCAFAIANTCLISKNAVKVIAYGAIGVGAVYAYNKSKK